MRAFILALGLGVGSVSVSLAMPVAPVPAGSTAIQVHGCHRHYAQDITGWHRHDLECRTLRGFVARKGRAKS